MKKTKIKFLENPTGKFNLSFSKDEVVEIESKQAEELIDAGYAKKTDESLTEYKELALQYLIKLSPISSKKLSRKLRLKLSKRLKKKSKTNSKSFKSLWIKKKKKIKVLKKKKDLNKSN